MKKIMTLFVGILIFSCNSKPKKLQQKSSPFNQKENFDWLLGKWKRINNEEGKETFENWNKLNDTVYMGIGFTLQNGDTLSQEKIKLNKINEKWNLTVTTPKMTESILFAGASHTTNEFICKNPENDFPKVIKYWKNGQKLNASVSNSEMNILFEFGRLK